MRYTALIIFSAAFFAAASSVSAQYFTPAPVDLTGKVPGGSGGEGINALVNPYGELFVFNPGGGIADFLTNLVVTCEIDCLNPDGYVALSEQAAVPALADQYVGLYGDYVLDSGFPDYERQSTSEILAFGDYMDFPIGADKAFSLGRIVEGTPAQILQWAEHDEIVVRWQMIQLGLELQGEFPVQYTTFVPEPSTIGLAALGMMGSLLARRRGLRTILPLALLAVCSAAASAQDFTPAPVDLTGRGTVPPPRITPLTAAVSEVGELFVWGDVGWISQLTIHCDIECLDPGAFVPLRVQAEFDPTLQDIYLDLFGELSDLGVKPGSTTSELPVLTGNLISLEPGQHNAFSLGRIVNGTPQQILEWVDAEEIVVEWGTNTPCCSEGEFPVQYTTFVPEPSSIALVALGVAGLLLAGSAGLRKSVSTAGRPIC